METEAEISGVSEILSIARQGKKHASHQINGAELLRQTARDMERKARDIEFETAHDAVTLLVNAWKQGDLSEPELLYAQAELYNIKQRAGEAYDAEDIANKYRLLQPGEHVLNLQDMANRSITGQIVEAPQNFTMYPGRLGATWELSVTTGRRSVDIRMDTETLHLSRAIGHEAVATVVSETYLSWHDDKSMSNIDELKNLRSKVSSLYALGMSPVETTPLDEAIAEWEEKHNPSRNSADEELLDETTDVKSLWRRIFGKIGTPR